MAKKRRKSDKEPEEEYEFRPPEFDEKDFIRKELAETRSVVFTVVYAIVLGVVAGLLSAADTAFMGPAFLIALAGMVSLPWVYPMFRIDSKAFQKRNWLGNIGTFFFTFLAIWILLLNQPFADFAKPDISDVTVWVDKPGNTTAIDYKFSNTAGVYQWTPRYGVKLDQVIHANANNTLNLTAKVADNHELKHAQISVNNRDYVSMTFEGKNRWGYKINATSLAPELTIRISAEDESGNQQVLIIGPAIPVVA